MNKYVKPKESSDKKSVQEKLDSLKPLRKGKVKAVVDGIYGRCVPIMTTNCICCRKPSPIVLDGRFICRKCVLIFPVRGNIELTKKGFEHVVKSRKNVNGSDRRDNS